MQVEVAEGCLNVLADGLERDSLKKVHKKVHKKRGIYSKLAPAFVFEERSGHACRLMLLGDLPLSKYAEKQQNLL